jgi:hypothetical protein
MYRNDQLVFLLKARNFGKRRVGTFFTIALDLERVALMQRRVEESAAREAEGERTDSANWPRYARSDQYLKTCYWDFHGIEVLRRPQLLDDAEQTRLIRECRVLFDFVSQSFATAHTAEIVLRDALPLFELTSLERPQMMVYPEGIAWSVEDRDSDTLIESGSISMLHLDIAALCFAQPEEQGQILARIDARDPEAGKRIRSQGVPVFGSYDDAIECSACAPVSSMPADYCILHRGLLGSPEQRSARLLRSAESV